MAKEKVKRLVDVKFTYFKESGKYYAEGTAQIEATILEGDSVYLYDVMDEVAHMIRNDKLPGLAGTWGHAILLEAENMVPQLMMGADYKDLGED